MMDSYLNYTIVCSERCTLKVEKTFASREFLPFPNLLLTHFGKQHNSLVVKKKSYF